MNALFVNSAIWRRRHRQERQDLATSRFARHRHLAKRHYALVASAYGVSASEAYPAEPAPLVDGTDVATAAHDDAQNCLFIGTAMHARLLRRLHQPRPGPLLFQRSSRPALHSGSRRRTNSTATSARSEAPNCRGLSGGEVQTLDWRAVDLEQWTTILGTSERLPGARRSDSRWPDRNRQRARPCRPRCASARRHRTDAGFACRGIEPARVRSRGRDEIRGGGAVNSMVNRSATETHVYVGKERTP